MSEATLAAAELFALVHTGTDGDVMFYVEICEGAESILELGCGHGRVLVPLCTVHNLVVGLDIDPARLDLARRALRDVGIDDLDRVRLVEGDMRRFALDERFDRIVIPYNGLYALPDETAQLACLQRAREHLTDEGLVIWDAYAIDAFHHSMRPQDIDVEDDEPVDTIEWRGNAYLVFEHSTWLKDAQRIRVRYRYLPLEPELQIHEQTVEHRYLLTSQLDALCARAGLVLTERFGDFDGNPLRPDSEHMVCVACAA